MSQETVSTENISDRVDNVMEILEKDPELQQDDEEDTDANAPDPASDSNAEPPKKKDAIGEDQEKTNDAEKDKLQAEPGTIEPPVSWPSDDKEAFKALPTWAQERISARENEREAFVSERTRTLAAREKDLNDLQTRTSQAQEKYSQELQRLNSIATQLMPAKFSDIQSEADYLKMKVEDPARASEYEAFVQVLRNAQGEHTQQQQAQFKQHMDSQWSNLQEKFPEFKDPVKAKTILDDVRKAAVEWYGFTPQEVEVIAEHRHIPVLRDAIAWRKHQANLKAAEGKKVAAKQPNAPVLRNNGASSGANLGADDKSKILNRASGETDLRKKADLIARTL